MTKYASMESFANVYGLEKQCLKTEGSSLNYTTAGNWKIENAGGSYTSNKPLNISGSVEPN